MTKRKLEKKDHNQVFFYQQQAISYELFNQGRFYYSVCEYELARVTFIDAISLDPTNAAYINNLGMVYSAVNEYESAINAFNIAIEIDPTNAVYFNNLGMVYFALGQHQWAISAFSAAIVINPSSDELFWNLGQALFAAGENEQAISAFIKTTELDPINIEYYNNLGAIYLKLGKYELTLEPLFKSICISNNLDYITSISSLIEPGLSDLEKQQMIEELIIPLCTDLLKKEVVKDTAKICGADVMVKYAELTKFKSKVIVEGAIKVYLAIATREALYKASLLLATNDCFTEMEKEEYKIQVSNLIVLIGEISEEFFDPLSLNVTPEDVAMFGAE